MSSTGTPGVSKLATISITGNPTWDTALRYGLIALAGVLTGAVTGWLNARGFHDPNLTIYVGTGVSTLLGGLAVAAWGLFRSSNNEAVVRFREAIAVQAGINVAESLDHATPNQVSVPLAQKIIAEHGTSPLQSK